MEEDAIEIARIIKGTDSDERGYLFLEVAKQLKFKEQGYTAKLFTAMAETYGYDTE